MSVVDIWSLQASWIKREEPCLLNSLCKSNSRSWESPDGVKRRHKEALNWTLCMPYLYCNTFNLSSIIFCIHYYSIRIYFEFHCQDNDVSRSRTINNIWNQPAILSGEWEIFRTFNFRSLRRVRKLADYENFPIYGILLVHTSIATCI